MGQVPTLVFSPPAGAYSYALFISLLIGLFHTAAGNRLTASLERTTGGTGNKWTSHNKKTAETVLGPERVDVQSSRSQACVYCYYKKKIKKLLFIRLGLFTCLPTFTDEISTPHNSLFLSFNLFKYKPLSFCCSLSI